MGRLTARKDLADGGRGLVEELFMAPRSKAHIRGVMQSIFECATRLQLFNERENLIALVRLRGGSKRRQHPTTLTVGKFELIVATPQEPWRTMLWISEWLGLRVSEIAAVQWDDFDFEKKIASRPTPTDRRDAHRTGKRMEVGRGGAQADEVELSKHSFSNQEIAEA